MSRKPIVVAAAVIKRRGRVFIARRGRGPLRGKWEFPGGKVEVGETPEECLVRELREELGINVIVEKQIAEVEYQYESGVVRLFVFLVKWAGGTMEPTEHDALAWVSPHSLLMYDLAPADEPVARRLAEEATSRVRRQKTGDL